MFLLGLPFEKLQTAARKFKGDLGRGFAFHQLRGRRQEIRHTLTHEQGFIGVFYFLPHLKLLCITDNGKDEGFLSLKTPEILADTLAPEEPWLVTLAGAPADRLAQSADGRCARERDERRPLAVAWRRGAGRLSLGLPSPSPRAPSSRRIRC